MSSLLPGVPMSPEPLEKNGSIRFGSEYELDLRAYQLRRLNRPLPLEPIPMEILRLLLEENGHLVTRSQIVARIWGNEVHVDASSSINAAVVKIRRALHDDSGKPRFVETIARKGYRFIAPVQQGSAFAESTPVGSPSEGRSNGHAANAPELVTAPLSLRQRVVETFQLNRWQAYLVISLLLALVIVSSFPRLRNWWRSSSEPVHRRVMLAVLPFANLTGDAGEDYFSDGMTEEIISSIGRIDPEHLVPIARTSVMRYKRSQEPLPQIGRELGVQYALEGSVRRDANVVRVLVRLIQLKDQTELWSRQYDREVGNVLSLQGEIAQEIAQELQPKLVTSQSRLSAGRSASSESEQSYESYLRGRYFLAKRTPESLQRSIDYFEQAVKEDNNNARAYAALAKSYALISGYSALPPEEYMPKARAAARRAIELDDGSPEAHAALAMIAQTYDWDWQTAEKEYRYAIQLDPNYATGHHWYAECLALQGHFDQAMSEIEHARVLDPLSLIIATDRGTILYFSRHYDLAIEQFRSVLEAEPNFPRAHMLATAYLAKGMSTEALADAQSWVRANDTPWSRAILAYTSGRSGHPEMARQEVTYLTRLSRNQPMDPLALSVAYLGLGDEKQALAELEQAYRKRSSGLTALKVDTIYDPLRGKQRFNTLLHQLNLE